MTVAEFEALCPDKTTDVATDHTMPSSGGHYRTTGVKSHPDLATRALALRDTKNPDISSLIKEKDDIQQAIFLSRILTQALMAKMNSDKGKSPQLGKKLEFTLKRQFKEV